MRPIKYFPLFFLMILLAPGTTAQTNPVIRDTPEIKNERGMYSKVFLKENGDHVAIISSAPVHYKKNGTWEEINTGITSVNGSYQNETNIFQSYFPGRTDSAGKIKLIVNNTNELFFHSEKKLVLLNDQGDLTVAGVLPDHSMALVTGNTITYPGIYTGISDEFTVLNGGLKNNIILSAPPALLNDVSSGYFGFRETAELPEGWKIIAQGNTADSLTSSSLLIIDSKYNPILTIPAPVFYDHYGQEPDGANSVEGKYLVKQENDRWSIITLVPVAWLKDVNTKYPVSIDPTVVIAGTTGGWQSPNNFVDNPGFVFLGVCCSNLTHRAWIKFNTTAIPAGSCISDVELQVNVNTVVATTPELVWINDVTGTFGPYGAINAAAYTDFGNGVYTSFTINGTGIYGYYVLGASANALLQSQLPGGWFQVGLMLNNEPSTNYKIINGTASNLMVTYTSCTLPVELLSFDAKCNNGEINLNWATASQLNNDYFTIEKTRDGINYEAAGTVAGAGTSNQILYYSFVDPAPSEGTWYYALKQTDFNGQFKYIGLAEVNCNSVPGFTVRTNPGTGNFIIEGVEQNSDVVVTDVLGQIVFRARITGEKTELDLNNQVNGIYFIRVITNSGLATKKIIISK